MQFSSRAIAEAAWGSGVAHIPSIAMHHQGRRRIGPVALCTFPLASPGSQVRASLGPAGYCRRSGYGGIQPCLPAAHHVAPSTAWHGPAPAPRTQDPRVGPSLMRRTTPRPPRGSAPSGWFPRDGEFNARSTSQGSANMSHDDQGQAGARRAPGERRVQVSSSVQARQATRAES